MKKYIFNTVLVHVARTWERIRLEQPYQEMPYDNIESVDEIVRVTDHIMLDEVIKKLIEHGELYWDWEVETKGKASFSDEYIEQIATQKINSLINN